MNKENVIILDIAQGSDEWFEIRKTHVTSTDQAIINGTNKRKNTFQLWQEKLGIISRESSNYRMKEGTLLEQEARDWYNRTYNTNFEPCCLMNKKYPWLFTSLDGYDKKTSEVLEIKCGVATYDQISKGCMPAYYTDQAQHHICVSEQTRCHYVAYRPDKAPISFFIERDQQHIDNLLEKSEEFYYFLQNMVPPPFSDKEFFYNNDKEANQKAINWLEKKKILEEAIKQEKIAKECLLDETDGGNMIFTDANVKVELIEKKGLINYDQILKDHKLMSIDFEKYRKQSSVYLSLKQLKN